MWRTFDERYQRHQPGNDILWNKNSARAGWQKLPGMSNKRVILPARKYKKLYARSHGESIKNSVRKHRDTCDHFSQEATDTRCRIPSGKHEKFCQEASRNVMLRYPERWNRIWSWKEISRSLMRIKAHTLREPKLRPCWNVRLCNSSRPAWTRLFPPFCKTHGKVASLACSDIVQNAGLKLFIVTHGYCETHTHTEDKKRTRKRHTLRKMGGGWAKEEMWTVKGRQWLGEGGARSHKEL